MKTLTGNNMATLIPPWATSTPPYACDAGPTRCNLNVYEAIYDYDDTGCNRSITSSTSVTTVLSDASESDANEAFFLDPAGGHEWESDDSGMSLYGYRYYNPDLGRWLNRDPIGEKGGVNVYGFVGNQAVSETDLLGLIGGIPSSPPWGGSGQNSIAIGPGNQVLGMQIQGMCGQIDVTTAVNNVLDRVADVYENDWDRCERKARCKALYHSWYAFGAWDIHPLGGIGLHGSWPFGMNIQAGTGYGCERTVVYDGKCYRAGALNYVMWGKANSLCRDTFTWNPIHTLTASRTLVFAWKAVYLWAQVGEAMAFTTYGYNGGDAPDCDLPNCFVYGDITVPLTDFTYTWDRVN